MVNTCRRKISSRSQIIQYGTRHLTTLWLMQSTGSGRAHFQALTKSLFYSQPGKSPKRKENKNHNVSISMVQKPQSCFQGQIQPKEIQYPRNHANEEGLQSQRDKKMTVFHMTMDILVRAGRVYQKIIKQNHKYTMFGTRKNYFIQLLILQILQPSLADATQTRSALLHLWFKCSNHMQNSHNQLLSQERGKCFIRGKGSNGMFRPKLKTGRKTQIQRVKGFWESFFFLV